MNEMVTDLENYLKIIQERNEKDSVTLLTMIQSLSKESIQMNQLLSEKENEIILKDQEIMNLNELRSKELNDYTTRTQNQQSQHDQEVQILTTELNEKNHSIEMLTAEVQSLQSQMVQQQQLHSTQIAELERQLDESQQQNNLLNSQIRNFESEIKQFKKLQLQLTEENEKEKIKYNEKITKLINENENYSLQLRQLHVTQNENILTHQLLEEKQQECLQLQQKYDEAMKLIEEKDDINEKLTQDVLTAKMESVKYFNDYDVEVKKVAQLTRALAATKIMNESDDDGDRDHNNSNSNSTSSNSNKQNHSVGSGAGGGGGGGSSHGLGLGGMKFNLKSVADKMSHLVKEQQHPSAEHEGGGHNKK